MRINRLLPLSFVCLIGCGGPTIVGKWSTKVREGTTTMEFTSNTFTQSSDGEANGVKMHLELSGTYTFDGKKMKMNVTAIKLPDQLKAFAAAFDKIKEKPIDVAAKLDKDTLVLAPEAGGTGAAGAGVAGTFTRVK